MSAEEPKGLKNEGLNMRPGPALFAQLKKEIPEEYKPLIRSEEAHINRSLGAVRVGQYFTLWMRGQHKEHPTWAQDNEFLAEHLAGAPLVDLGSGSTDDEWSVARHYKASVYVGVDIWPLGAKDKALDPLSYDEQRYRETLPSVEKRGQPETMLVRSDMLDYIARLPDNSVNVMLNGLDFFDLKPADAYLEALAKEIVRVLKPGGIAFGNNMGQELWAALCALKSSADGYELRERELPSAPPMFRTLEKVRNPSEASDS